MRPCRPRSALAETRLDLPPWRLALTLWADALPALRPALARCAPRLTGAAMASEQISVIAKMMKSMREGRKRDLIKRIPILVRNTCTRLRPTGRSVEPLADHQANWQSSSGYFDNT